MKTEASEYLSLLQEIQNNNVSTFTVMPADEPRFTIETNSRNIIVPSEFSFLSVQNDHRAETIYFEIDRYFDNVDLSQHTCVVQFINKSGTTINEGTYPVTSMDIDSVDGKIVFGWEIRNDATQLTGDITFSVRFYSIDNNGNFTYNFNTLTASSYILPSLNIIASGERITATELEVWTDKMNNLASSIESDIITVEEKIEEFENYIASISEDYTALTEEVSQLSGEITDLKESGTGATTEQIAQIEKNKNDIACLEEILNGGSGGSSTSKEFKPYESVYLTGPARYGFLIPLDPDGGEDLVRGKEVTLYCLQFSNKNVIMIGALSETATATANTTVVFDEDGYYTFTPSYDVSVPYIRFVCFDTEITADTKMYIVTEVENDNIEGSGNSSGESGQCGLVGRVGKLETDLAKNRYDIDKSVDSKIAQAVNKDLKIFFASDIHFGVENQLTDDRRWGYTDDERMEIFIDTIKHENSLGTIDCLIFAGDQASNNLLPDAIGGVEKDYLPEFVERMKAIGIPFYCTNGNHELYTDAKWRELFGYGSNYIITIKDYDIIVLNNFADTSTTIPTSSGYLLSDISNEVKTSILNYLNASDNTKAIVVSHYCEEDTMELPNTAEVVAHEKVLFALDGHCHTLKEINKYTIGGKPVLNCGHFSTDTTPNSYFSYRIFKDEDGLIQSYAVKPACDYEVNGEVVSIEYTKCYTKTFEGESVDYGIDIIKL